MAQDLSPRRKSPGCKHRLFRIDWSRPLKPEVGACCTAGAFRLERFALGKLARLGQDHHNLDAAFSEVLT